MLSSAHLLSGVGIVAVLRGIAHRSIPHILASIPKARFPWILVLALWHVRVRP